MKRIKVLSIINTVYNGLVFLMLIGFALVMGYIGIITLGDSGSNNGEAFAGFFAILAAVASAVVGIAICVQFVLGIKANIKANGQISIYRADSIRKLKTNGILALVSLPPACRAFADGDIRMIVPAIIFFIFTGLSVWQYIEVSRQKE